MAYCRICCHQLRDVAKYCPECGKYFCNKCNINRFSLNYIFYFNIQELIKSKEVELNDIIDTYLTWVVINNEHILYLGVK